MNVNVIGAGLAGCEAAYQLAKRGIAVSLYECKPDVKSPAHKVGTFAELVCSNSLKSDLLSTASGLLKAELRLLGSELIRIADEVKVPAGSALAVNRELFAEKITEKLRLDPNIEIVCQTVTDWDTDEYTIIATGPLTLDGLAAKIAERFGAGLHFYDAAAPLVSAASVDMESAWFGSRYDKDGKLILKARHFR